MGMAERQFIEGPTLEDLREEAYLAETRPHHYIAGLVLGSRLVDAGLDIDNIPSADIAQAIWRTARANRISIFPRGIMDHGDWAAFHAGKVAGLHQPLHLNEGVEI
jgi:hypothetical protein